jgi:CRISPR/Cas system CSM-associated protein Csm4 (group 5 of RAMP superfamily)
MLAAQQAIRLLDIVLLPRVDVRDKGAEGSHFYTAHLVTADNQALENRRGDRLVPDLYVHFYFLVRSRLDDDNPVMQCLHTLINLLPDTGIGGERSAGCGLFELVSPADAVDMGRFKAYQTVLRGGRETAHDGPLKVVRMLAEGALQVETEGIGQIADISPAGNRRYLRYGKAFNIPVAY